MIAKVNVVLERLFTTMSPFAKNLLVVSKEGQSVYQCLEFILIS